jgi:hypothetical protein
LAGVGLVSPTFAQSGFYLPTSTPPAGQDEFRASDGTSCKTTMDGTRRVELGAFGSGGRDDQRSALYGVPSYASTPTSSNLGVYGRYVMSLDAPSQRMDCSKLYELELERRRLEVEMMRRNLTGADERLDAMQARRVSAPVGRGGHGSRAGGAPAKGGKAAKGTRSARMERPPV